MTVEPLDECGGCGADLFDGVKHFCPVLGTWVLATTEMPEEEDE